MALILYKYRLFIYFFLLFKVSVAAGNIALTKLGQTLANVLDETNTLFYEDKLHDALLHIVDRYTEQLQKTNSWSQIVGLTLACLVGVILIIGLLVTIKFCHSELKQGKSCQQVCAGIAGGHTAFLLGGHPVENKESGGTPAETETL